LLVRLAVDWFLARAVVLVWVPTRRPARLYLLDCCDGVNVSFRVDGDVRTTFSNVYV